MPDYDVWVANPTSATVTVGDNDVPAGSLTLVTIQDDEFDPFTFLTAGCILVADATTVDEACQGAQLVSSLRARQ